MVDTEYEKPIGAARAQTHPSLALTKYWGKIDSIRNLPATPSLALGLSNLTTETEAAIYPGVPHDEVYIDERLQKSDRFAAFFRELRRIASERMFSGDFRVVARSHSNFPVAAGIASSASGFAALALACCRALDLKVSDEELSSLARIGSASAARSVFGGFTLLPAGAEHARILHDAKWWPELRVAVILTEQGPKSTSSRDAMESCRRSSPFYDAWISDAVVTTDAAISALEERNLRVLGPLVRLSYLRMFATMHSASPPIRYWNVRSFQVLEVLEELRRDGASVWETMDAGPQVKVLCEEESAESLIREITTRIPDMEVRLCAAAAPPRVWTP